MSRVEGVVGAAVAAWGADAAWGWAIAPGWTKLLRLSRGRVLCVREKGSIADEVEADLSTAYEVRVFDHERQLTWRYDQAARVGRWSVLDDAAARARGWLPAHEHADRLVAGVADRNIAGWSRTRGGAGSTIWVPFEVAPGKHIVLRVVEYVTGWAEDEPHGNVAVAAERACGWKELG